MPGTRSSGAVTDLTAHLVFVVKYRRPVFTLPVLNRCETILRETADTLSIEVLEINGEPDHLHLLIRYPATLSIAVIAGRLKGSTSRALRQEFPEHLRKHLWGEHFWTPSYYAASSGGAPLATIKQYIHKQARPTWPERRPQHVRVSSPP